MKHLRFSKYKLTLNAFFIFLIFTNNYSYSQVEKSYNYCEKNNINFDLLFTSSGQAGKDTNQSNLYFAEIGIYLRVGYFITNRLNGGIRLNYSFYKTNMEVIKNYDYPYVYQIGMELKYYLIKKPKFNFYVGIGYFLSNIYYEKDTSFTSKNLKIHNIYPYFGFNVRLYKHLFFNLDLDNNFTINRPPVSILYPTLKFGLTYFIKKNEDE